MVQRIWWGCAAGGLGRWVWRVDEGLGGTEEDPSSLPLEFYTTEREIEPRKRLWPQGGAGTTSKEDLFTSFLGR